jgi:hypothetical protein
MIPFATEEKRAWVLSIMRRLCYQKQKQNEVTLTHWSFEVKQYRGCAVRCVTLSSPKRWHHHMILILGGEGQFYEVRSVFNSHAWTRPKK